MIEYIFINLVIATGIAADAVIVTLAKLNRFSSWAVVWRWSGAVGLTHWLFPFCGFVGGWILLSYDTLRAGVFLVAAALMALLSLNAYRNALKTPKEGVSAAGSKDLEPRFPTLGLVWAVSVDALVTGPGKVPAAATWTTNEIVLSFPIVGAMVGTYVLSAAVIALIVNGRVAALGIRHQYSRRVTNTRTFFLFLETCAFAVFAALGLDRAAAILFPVIPHGIIVWSGPLVTATAWIILGRRLRASQTADNGDVEK
ncbi:MAG: hypothetical protein HUU55_04985 [Myxococcales bacterium]|nr:hypothetical protein [Myxococcales bacterium]